MNWKRQLVRALLGFAVASLAVSTATAQTIRPLVSEFKEKARGRVELVNDAEWPLDVVLQTRGFTISDEGELKDDVLAPGLRIKLSAMSIRIPAGQSRFVFYEATADRTPAWFVLYALYTGFPSRETGGLNVQIELPHVVYLLPKSGVKANDVRARLVAVNPEGHQAVVDVENVGPNFVRVLSTEIQAAGKNAQSISFPLLPGGRRRLEVPWDSQVEPSKVVLKGRGFSFERLLVPPSP